MDASAANDGAVDEGAIGGSAGADASTNPEGSDYNQGLKQFLQSKWFRVLFTVLIAAAAVYAFSQEITEKELRGAFVDSNLWWVCAAAVCGALTWVGAAIPLMALARVRVPFKEAVLVQIASTFIDIAAPAGMGAVALHLRYLIKRGVSGARATATVLLIEVSQFVGSVILLVVFLLITRADPSIHFPLKWVSIGLAALAVFAVVIGLLPKIRKQLIAKAIEWWQGMRPNLVWAIHHPKEQFISLGGVAIQSAASAGALMFCLLAVGHPVSFALSMVVFIVASTVGSMVPTPGGIGSAEAAYTAALVLVGVPAAVALSAVILFRVVTLYAQVPIGWIGWTVMQRKKLL